MPIKRADIYEHNNPDRAFVDSDYVNGGFRSAVGTVEDLYAFSGKTGLDPEPENNNPGSAGQMKEFSTVVYVTGETTYYVLKDIENISNSNGWEVFGSGTGSDASLKLDQTIQQSVINGQAKFNEGIILGDTPSASSISGHTKGKMYYDESYQTVSVDVGNDSTLQLGQEMVRYIFNDTGSIIPNGSVVYSTGVHSVGIVDVTTVGLAIGDNPITSEVIGVSTQEIGIGEYGYTTCRGNINGLNTDSGSQYSGMTVGDVIYLSATVLGGITNIAPESPNLHIKVGRLLTKDSVNGKIFVEIAQTHSLNDILDVSVVNPSLDNVLKWNGVEWVDGVVGAVSAGPSINIYYSTPVINAVTSPAGISEDGSDGNGIQIATLVNEPIITGTISQLVISASDSDLRAFSAWECATVLGRDTINSGLWEFYDYVSVDERRDVTYLIHQIQQIVDITGSTVTTTGTGANTRTATISSGEFIGEYLNPSVSNLDASYLQTPNGIYQINSLVSSNIVNITVPTGYINENSVNSSVWNPLFSGSTESIEDEIITLYQTKILSPSFNINKNDRLGEILFVDSTRAVDLTLSYDGSSESSYMKTPFVTLHNDLSGLQGGNLNERYHIDISQLNVINNTTGINSGDETKITIESKLTGEIITHNHPYSGLTGTPDLSLYQLVSGFTSYTATTETKFEDYQTVSDFTAYSASTQSMLDNTITGVTNNGVGVGISGDIVDNVAQFNTIIGSGNTSVTDGGSGTIVVHSPVPDTGTTTSVENLVGGTGLVYSDTTGSTLQLRTLLGGLNTTITTTGDTILFDSKEVFSSDFVVAINDGSFGKFVDGDTVPAQGLTANEVIILACTEAPPPVPPTVSLSSSSNVVSFGEDVKVINLVFSYAINEPNASVASVLLEAKRNGDVDWRTLTTNDSLTTFQDNVDDSADRFNTNYFEYKYTVVDTSGNTTVRTHNVTPEAYLAPTITSVMTGVVTSPETQVYRQNGNVDSDVSGTITSNRGLVDITGWTLQRNYNGGTWTTLSSGTGLGTQHVSISTFSDTAIPPTADSVSYRITYSDEYSSGTGGTRSISFNSFNYAGISTSSGLDGTGIVALGNSAWATSVNKTITYDTLNTEYAFYAYPSTLVDVSSISMLDNGGGLPIPIFGAFLKFVSNVNVVNDYGVSQEYKLYRSKAYGAFSTDVVSFS